MKVEPVQRRLKLLDEIRELMFDPPPDFNERVKSLILQNPTLIRSTREKQRQFDLRSASGKKRSLYYQKHLRKHVF